ncbi:hypothetical protein ACX0G9_27490 [Flavitalea flava]
MKFAFVGEGLTDHIVVKNLLIGLYNDKNLALNRLLPKEKEPVGWGNVLRFLSTEEFQTGVKNSDYIIIQIDTDKCEEWKEGLPQIGDDESKIDSFISQVTAVLITKIGEPFYTENKPKFIFAISVHELECWLLPFNSNNSAHQAKMVNCLNTLEKIATAKGFSLHQKNYQGGRHYDDFSTGMKKNSELKQKYGLNPSLKIFIQKLPKAIASGSDEIVK